ncbi:hypothetical protein GCM10007857_89040 [Bradyrhizobium iriomotense]|uniref:Uncharacterized protein n=1 Tax=Bradyrhizobium iriomotense TaxID=441950 RepID=A0ABQ6BCS2_9BRAD|nr:hypothetical protein GCM10007857_89040 [Bradyrhizobium iriomotense]
MRLCHVGGLNAPTRFCSKIGGLLPIAPWGRSEYEKRVGKARRLTKEYGKDALLVTSEHNFQFFVRRYQYDSDSDHAAALSFKSLLRVK